MPPPLTDSSRFASLMVEYYYDVGWKVQGRTSEGTRIDIDVDFAGNARYGGGADELAILRTIYASESGLLDADGDPLTVQVSGWPFGSTLDSYEANGFANPLDAASVARAARRREFDGAVFNELAAVTEDATSERPDAAVRFGFVPTRRQPTVFNYSLDRWRTTSNNAISFNFVVDFALADAITTSNAGERTDIQAMMRWLETLRQSGDPVDLTATTHGEIAASIARTRTYSFTQDTGSVVTATCVGVTYDTLRYTISFIETDTSAASHDPALLDLLLEATSVQFSPSGDAEEPPFGAYDIPTRGAALEFDEHHRLALIGGRLMMRGHDSGGTIYHADLGGAGRTVPYSALPTLDTGERGLPIGFAQNVVHFGPSAAAVGTIRLQPPQDVIPVPGGEYEFTIHNRDSAHDLGLDDWSGSEICTLHPGERITLRLTRRTDGSGELVSVVPFVRLLHISGSNYGFMNSDNGWYWRHDEGSKYTRCIRMPEDSHQFSQRTYHEDAFSVGTLTYQATSDPGLYTLANLNTIHSVDIGRAGYLRCEFQCGMYFGGSGSVPQGSGLRMALQNGSDDTALRTVGQPLLSVPSTMTLQTAFERDVVVGDIIAPLFFYPDTMTVPIADIRNVSYHLEMSLAQDISLEYTPA